MSDDLSGFSMFELFRAEAETHAAAMSQGLLEIESRPDDRTQLDRLMRSAHSVKGAARIIGLDDLVVLAHAMEDCFVAVQKGHEQLVAARVDQLLQGIDIFQKTAGMPEEQAMPWIEAQAEAMRQLAANLRQPTSGGSSAPEPRGAPQPGGGEPKSDAGVLAAPRMPPDQESGGTVSRSEPKGRIGREAPPGPGDKTGPDRDEPLPHPAVSPPRQSERQSVDSDSGGPDAEDRPVPVNASNLNQIMRLASESMVESRRFEDVERTLRQINEVQRKLAACFRATGPVAGLRQPPSLDRGQFRELSQSLSLLLQEHAAHVERLAWRSAELSTALYHEVIRSRMRPFVEGTTAFPRMIRDLARSLQKEVVFQVMGQSVAVDRDILRRLEAPLNHLLRNCVDHGIETPDVRRSAGKPESGHVTLEAHHFGGMLTVRIRDDGQGIDKKRLRQEVMDRKLIDATLAEKLSDSELLEFLFLPGFSTTATVTEVSGRGVGLDVVRSMVQQVSGTVRVETTPGEGTVFTLHLPVTLSVIRAALVEIAGEPYAFPLSRLMRIVRLLPGETTRIQGRLQFSLDGQSVGLVRAADILGLQPESDSEDETNVVVVGDTEKLCGVVVDRFVGEQDLVVRPLDPRLGKIPHITAAAIMQSGDPLLIIDVEDLLQSIEQMLGEGRLRGMTAPSSGRRGVERPRILVVDDSITVREVQRHLLATRGYEVDVAVDGQDGWNALCGADYDLLITDVDMPRMNGIELIRAVRQDPRFADLPIIIVSYKEREEDRMRGLQVGANAYLTKGSFHDDSLLTTVADLAGRTQPCESP